MSFRTERAVLNCLTSSQSDQAAWSGDKASKRSEESLIASFYKPSRLIKLKDVAHVLGF
jgi:hypothetical protein